MCSNMEIIIGTYEEFLLGYKVDIKVMYCIYVYVPQADNVLYLFFQDDNKTTITQSFADKSHSGSIRCLAVKDKWVATGATDDRIFIYDMSVRKQSQVKLRRS